MNDGDPLINLSLGIAFIHRAMNRQTDNRHLQIVQVGGVEAHVAVEHLTPFHSVKGFTFLFKYYDLKGGNEEACYNIARAFHQIGRSKSRNCPIFPADIGVKACSTSQYLTMKKF